MRSQGGFGHHGAVRSDDLGSIHRRRETDRLILELLHHFKFIQFLGHQVGAARLRFWLVLRRILRCGKELFNDVGGNHDLLLAAQVMPVLLRFGRRRGPGPLHGSQNEIQHHVNDHRDQNGEQNPPTEIAGRFRLKRGRLPDWVLPTVIDVHGSGTA